MRQIVPRPHLVATLTWLACSRCLFCAEVDRSVESIEAKVLAHRAQIKSGTFAIEIFTMLKRKDVINEKRVHADEFLDADKCRIDCFHLGNSSDPLSKYQESFGKTLDNFWRYSTQEFSDGAKLVSRIDPPDSLNAKLHRIPDPRLIGMIPDTFANLSSGWKLNSFIGARAEGMRLDVSEELHRGVHCAKLSCQREDNNWTAWIDEKKDYSVIAMKRHFDGVQCLLETELMQNEGFGWFPSKVSLIRLDRDGAQTSETLTISATINQPLDKSVFELSGTKPKTGTIIHDFTAKPFRTLHVTADGIVPVKP